MYPRPKIEVHGDTGKIRRKLEEIMADTVEKAFKKYHLKLSEEDRQCGCPESLPWSLVEPIRAAMEEWTGVSLEQQLGITPEEFYCVYYGKTSLDCVPSTEELANWLADLVE